MPISYKKSEKAYLILKNKIIDDYFACVEEVDSARNAHKLCDSVDKVHTLRGPIHVTDDETKAPCLKQYREMEVKCMQQSLERINYLDKAIYPK